jgi:hypothetical protein
LLAGHVVAERRAAQRPVVVYAQRMQARLDLAVDVAALRIDQRERPVALQAAARRQRGGVDLDAVERLEREDAQPGDARRQDARTSGSPTATSPPRTTSA